jgi:hypothetical protein
MQTYVPTPIKTTHEAPIKTSGGVTRMSASSIPTISKTEDATSFRTRYWKWIHRSASRSRYSAHPPPWTAVKSSILLSLRPCCRRSDTRLTHKPPGKRCVFGDTRQGCMTFEVAKISKTRSCRQHSENRRTPRVHRTCRCTHSCWLVLLIRGEKMTIRNC